MYALPPFWQVRKYAVAGPIILTAFSVSGLVFLDFSPLTTVLLLIGVFRIINHLRIAMGRMHEQYLRRVSRRTGFLLGFLQGLALLGWLGFSFVWGDILPLVVAGQVFVGLLVLFSVLRNIVKTKHKIADEHVSDKDMPTVTVAIPARNETSDLEACLQSVLASKYPKLEILVLDDCSQDKTADIIKSFAHDGVRFVKGYEPEERWLAKNQAYDKLADEASGQFLLFCGVDVRLGPDAIRTMALALKSRKKDMISVMPRRLSGDTLSAFVQPMRYWWELALPRRYFNRPAVLSTCWMIKRKTLKKLGGMGAVQHAIIPEGYFARELVKTDAYSFLRADNNLDVQTQKSLAAQRETTVRMRYPQARRRPEWVMFISLAEVMFLLGPFAVLASGFWAGFAAIQLFALLACVLLVLSHILIVQLANPPNTLVAAFNFPLVVMTELALGYISMFKYEFSEVQWKGRNICLPVMHVYPHLPHLDAENSKFQKSNLK